MENETKKDEVTDLAGQAGLDTKEADIVKRKEALAVEEEVLAEAERQAGLRAKRLEIDAREDAGNELDEMIGNHQTGTKAKPGQPFIDGQGRQHPGNCNSHPSKRTRYPCDCGKNGTMRYQKDNR